MTSSRKVAIAPPWAKPSAPAWRASSRTSPRASPSSAHRCMPSDAGFVVPHARQPAGCRGCESGPRGWLTEVVREDPGPAPPTHTTEPAPRPRRGRAAAVPRPSRRGRDRVDQRVAAAGARLGVCVGGERRGQFSRATPARQAERADVGGALPRDARDLVRVGEVGAGTVEAGRHCGAGAIYRVDGPRVVVDREHQDRPDRQDKGNQRGRHAQRRSASAGRRRPAARPPLVSKPVCASSYARPCRSRGARWEARHRRNRGDSGCAWPPERKAPARQPCRGPGRPSPRVGTASR